MPNNADSYLQDASPREGQIAIRDSRVERFNERLHVAWQKWQDLPTRESNKVPPSNRQVPQTAADRATFDAHLESARSNASMAGRAKAAPSKRASESRDLLAEHVSDSVQIGHAIADVIVVDERDRLTIERPWITFAIDVFSRAVLGFYVSLDPPSATSIGMCLTQACLPKGPWLLARGLSHLYWPLCGLMDVLRSGTFKELRTEPLRQSCREHKIGLKCRTIGARHSSGHIERLIGTKVGGIQLLPDTAIENPRESKAFPGDPKTVMTLRDFEHLLCVEICEHYHREVHPGLGATPLGTWEGDIARGVSLKLPDDPKRFRLSFLPMETRILQPSGLHLFNVQYWSDALPAIVRRRAPLLIRYDPHDLSKIYVKAPDHSYLEVPYADIRLPPVSVWELRAARRLLAKRCDLRLTQERLFWAHAELQRSKERLKNWL
jgi:putative transposase